MIPSHTAAPASGHPCAPRRGAAPLRARPGGEYIDSPSLAQDVLIVGAFLPALAMVLSKPNEGPVPAWLERAARRWRRPRPSLAAGS